MQVVFPVLLATLSVFHCISLSLFVPLYLYRPCYLSPSLRLSLFLSLSLFFPSYRFSVVTRV